LLARRRHLFSTPWTPATWRARLILSAIPPTVVVLSIPVTVVVGPKGYWILFLIAPAMAIGRRHRDRVAEGEAAAMADPVP